MSNKTLTALQARLSAVPAASAEQLAVAFLLDIKVRMLGMGISNLELAQRLGTSAGYITRLFQDGANLSVSTMTRLAQAVGCSVRVQLEDAPDTRPSI